MLKKLISQWQFAKAKRANTLLFPQEQHLKGPLTSDQISCTLYQTCDKCPFDVFLDCLFDADYKRLIITGNPLPEVLANTWQNLYTEFRQLINANEQDDHFETMKDCNVAYGNVRLIEGILAALPCYYDPELVFILEQLDLKPGISGADSFEVITTKLIKVRTRGKKYVVQYEKKKAELEAIEKANEKKKGGRPDYEDTLMTLSREQGYAVKAHEITVTQYHRMVERLKQKYLKQQANGNRAD